MTAPPLSLPLRLNLTLLDDAWVPTLVTKYAHLLLAGLASEQAEPRGWAAVAQAALRPHHVTRVDDTHVIVLVPPQPDYDIAAPETLRLVVPLTESTRRNPPAVGRGSSAVGGRSGGGCGDGREAGGGSFL